MKHKIAFLLLSLSLWLSACGGTPVDTANKEGISSQLEESTPENSELTTSTEEDTSINSELEEAKAKADELASTAKDIENGDLYDYVTAICPSATLDVFEDGSLSVMLRIEDTSSFEDDIAKLFGTAEDICQNCHLEDNYSDITFLMRTESTLISCLVLLSYESPDSFKSDLTIFNHEHEKIIQSIYEESSLYKDIMSQFKDALSNLQY